MNRRDYLSLVAGGSLVGAAGCVSHPVESPDGPASPEGSHSTPGAPWDTPAPGTCEAVSLPKPSTGEGLPDPRPYPGKPAPFTESAVRTYLESFEAAYRHNRVLADVAEDGDCLDYLDVYATESQVSAVGVGFRGTVTTRGSYTGASCPGVTGSDTPTPLPHADFGGKSATYYLTDRFLQREGVVVQCFR